MAFRNSILAGEELVRTGIRSSNFVAGVAGWRVDRNGDAEFNNITVRGTLETINPVVPAAKIVISSDSIKLYTGAFGALAGTLTAGVGGAGSDLYLLVPTTASVGANGRPGVVYVAYNSAAGKTKIALDADELRFGQNDVAQDQHAAWAAYVVSINTMSGYGTSTRTGRWRRIGRTIHFQIAFTWAGAFTFGNANEMKISLPVAAVATMEQYVSMWRTIAGVTNLGYGYIQAGTDASNAILKRGDGTSITGTGVVAGDTTRVWGSYEAAGA